MTLTPSHMKRRGFLATGLAGMATPSIVRAAMTTLKFVPQIDLVFLDPHWSTANVTRGHGYMVFDTLYGQDGTYTPSAATATKRRRGQSGCVSPKLEALRNAWFDAPDTDTQRKICLDMHSVSGRCTEPSSWPVYSTDGLPEEDHRCAERLRHILECPACLIETRPIETSLAGVGARNHGAIETLSSAHPKQDAENSKSLIHGGKCE
jgi:hypothetical protein